MRATSAPTDSELSTALRRLRSTVGEARFPLDTPGAEAARAAARRLTGELDHYLIPRAARLDAPVLAVVGGSTGAGKSTLVNSLVRAPVSPAGVLRPTTRRPVLLCHPADGAWFGGHALLRDGAVEVVSAPSLTPGLALLDAPDIDSVVVRNRELAGELLAAADLWLFVTTAARYADAVPWRVLRGARDRGSAIAVVLDRVPPAVRDDVAADLGRLLSEQGLPGAPLFVVDESTLDRHGLLPANQVESIERHLKGIAGSDVRRRGVTRRTVVGALAEAATTADELAWVAAEQVTAAESLVTSIDEAFQRAKSTVESRLETGLLLRGEAYARWRECVASGELDRVLRTVQNPLRARPTAAPPGRDLHAALAGALVALLVEARTLIDDAIADSWRADSAGRGLLTQEPGDSVEAAAVARELVRDWQAWLRQEVRLAAPTARTRSRGTATAATVLLATIVALAPTIESTPAVARQGERAHEALQSRIEAYLGEAVQPWRHRLDGLGIDAHLVARLRSGAAEVGIARQLTSGLSRAA